MKNLKLKLSGMNCQHCVMNLSNVLKKIEGVKIEKIEINEAQIGLENENLIEIIKSSVKKIGYKIEEIEVI